MSKKLKTKTIRVIDGRDLYREIGRALKAGREQAGLTQDSVAMALGLTRTAWTNMEAGRGAIMLTNLYNFAMLVDRPVASFLPEI